MVRYFAFLSAAALVFVACGFPSIDFRPADEDDGSPSSSSSSGGMGGIGGTTSVGGEGGTLANCVVGDATSCPDGSKCTYDEVTGTIECVMAGNQPAWTRCNTDGDCEVGTFCDGVTSVCHPTCQNASQCANNASQCITATDTAGMPIPGFRVCTAHCNPYNASPCSEANGPTSCYYNANGGYWDCIRTVGLAEGSMCTGNTDCGRGLLCEAAGVCLRWCANIGEPFCSGLNSGCVAVNPQVTYNAQEVGICDVF